MVVSLLINLGSPVSEVRRAALNCIHSLSGMKESLFHPVLQHLGQKTEEIVSDPMYITQVFLLIRCVLVQVLAVAVTLFFSEEIKVTGDVHCFCQVASFEGI